MQLQLDLTEEEAACIVEAQVLAILFHEGKRLYAVTAQVNGAPWYGLVHGNSTALLPAA